MIELDLEQYFQVGSRLPPMEKAKLVKFLKANIDVFAWNAYDVPGIYLELVCHQLNVNLEVVPRKHPLQRSSKNHVEVVE